MSEVKLFVCCHRAETIPEHPLLVPIQVGTALAGNEFPGFLHDNSGENISGKNRSYCELTALYWMWKNTDCNYCGLFHYRRLLYPDTGARQPYIIRKQLTRALVDQLGYDHLEEMIRQYDIILPMAENMYVSVRDHYARATFHHGRDLTLVEEIVRELHPEYADAIESYLSGTEHYFGNIAIFSRTVLEDYCSWLFPVLSEFDRSADVGGYGVQEQRVDGYLAERLLGIYYTKQKDELKKLELPRVHIHGGKEYTKKKLMNTLLPPGSQRRAKVKRWSRGE